MLLGQTSTQLGSGGSTATGDFPNVDLDSLPKPSTGLKSAVEDLMSSADTLSQDQWEQKVSIIESRIKTFANYKSQLQDARNKAENYLGTRIESQARDVITDIDNLINQIQGNIDELNNAKNQ